MVRRGRDEADAGDGVADPGDDVIHLVAGQLTAFAGLGALRHFDLQFVGVHEVMRGDAEASGGHLLDGGAAGVTVGVGDEAGFVLTAFARVAAATDAVHGDGESFVRFLGDGAEGHGAGGETLHDFGGGLHIFERDGVALFELEEASQGAQSAVLFIHRVGVFLEGFEAFFANGLLQLADHGGIQQVEFAANAISVVAADREFGIAFRGCLVGGSVLHPRFLRQHVQADAFDAAGSAGEVFLDEVAVQANGFKDLRAAVALQRGDAHLREDFEEAFVNGLDVVILGLLGGNGFGQKTAHGKVFDGLDGEIRVDGAGTVTDEERVVHHFAGLAGFDEERDLGPRTFADQVVVNRG